MHSPERHFVSQKFGRAKATVTIESDNAGYVLVVFVDPALEARRFTFVPADFQAEVPGEHSPELIIRIAIGRLHHEVRHKSMARPTDRLSPGETRWLGDFITSVNGATMGYPDRRHDGEDRRRSDHRLDAAVVQGVEIGISEGKPAARHFMQALDVPPSVIRRILSRSAARR